MDIQLKLADIRGEFFFCSNASDTGENPEDQRNLGLTSICLLLVNHQCCFGGFLPSQIKPGDLSVKCEQWWQSNVGGTAYREYRVNNGKGEKKVC